MRIACFLALSVDPENGNRKRYTKSFCKQAKPVKQAILRPFAWQEQLPFRISVNAKKRGEKISEKDRILLPHAWLRRIQIWPRSI
jgi:hypothetical protein